MDVYCRDEEVKMNRQTDGCADKQANRRMNEWMD